MFALVDANAFYCSAEQVFQPQWRNKPIVVLSNNDGCIVAANRRARELGIPKFEPYFKIRKQCEQLGVIALSSNYELYSDLSAKMMVTIGRFAPEQHIYSIDESFLSLKGFNPKTGYLPWAEQLRQTVWKECRLPVSVGIAPTLTLAKAANHIAKADPAQRGVALIDTTAARKKVLQQMAAGDVWGIGRKLSRHLMTSGIKTAWQLASCDPAMMKRRFSVEMERTILELCGTPCIEWQQGRADKQQIFSTRSAGERITTLSALAQALCHHGDIAARKARKQQTLCRQLLCFAMSSPHDPNPVSSKACHHFAYPTADINQISSVVSHLAQSLFKEGVRFYKIGVGLLELVPATPEQLDLLNPNPNNPALMQLYDAINGRYGQHSLFMAAQGTSSAPSWQMKRNFLTPQYTTRWRDIPRISC